MPTLTRLLAGPHPVAVAVSQPDRGRGRGRRRSPSPVAALALTEGVPLLRPEKVGAEEVARALRAHEPDLGVVVAFGQFLPKRIRELPSCGYLINGHASLLPRHRGAAPIAHALLAGDTETGVSVMRVEKEMDAGPVALVRHTPILADDDAGSLGERIAALTADAIAEAVERIAEGTISWHEQDASLATFAPRIEREDARLAWREPACALARRVRAMAPKPGAFTELAGEPLRILAAHPEPGPCDLPPGRVRVQGGVLRIATGDGWLVAERLQRAGGRPLPAAELLRGRGLRDGELLGCGGTAQ